MSVRYESTRGKHNDLSFEEVVLGGLANDKGLFVPSTVPEFTLLEIENVGLCERCIYRKIFRISSEITHTVF